MAHSRQKASLNKGILGIKALCCFLLHIGMSSRRINAGARLEGSTNCPLPNELISERSQSFACAVQGLKVPFFDQSGQIDRLDGLLQSIMELHRARNESCLSDQLIAISKFHSTHDLWHEQSTVLRSRRKLDVRGMSRQ